VTTPIYYIKKGELDFGDRIIFESAELYLYPGDKICLIGKNGSGKSSLLKVISKEYELSSGESYTAPNIKVGYLNQSHPICEKQNLYQFILGSDWQALKYKADIILSQLEISGEDQIDELSGGQIRRAHLAKVLIDEPEILLLDEPTNHLDIKLIEWLESFVQSYRGTVLCISHDRAFLSNVTNKVWWIDKAIIRKSDKGFKYFEQWHEEVVEQEARELQKLSKKMQVEDDWLTYGVTARRKRNQKRLTTLIALREKLRNSQAQVVNSKQRIQAYLDESKKTQFIIEAEKISFGYGQQKLINDFSIRVKKGERIGIVGPNGAGKTTLLKILTKQLQPTEGRVRHGTELDIAYMDQNRSALKMEDTLEETICPGGASYVTIGDRTIHVASYLKQFMFDPKEINSKISILSGGQANRLLLAKTLICPGNLLILDEPTNDLDMETIEILLEILFDYTGTSIIVSHDRDFLDRLVNKTLVLNGAGVITEVIGGYQDYLKMNKQLSKPAASSAKKKEVLETKNNHDSGKLSYNQQRELSLLPKEIESLEKRILEIEELLSDQDLFVKDNNKFTALSKELKISQFELEKKISRWIELEA
jgi:ATP-binding cassette subfamily F protein uup